MIGKTISHYKILAKLGEGGMGVVYKAEDTKLKRIVALKFLSAIALGGEEKSRFLREAQAAAALNHPNICTIYEVDEADGQMFIAMEFIEGQSLREKIEVGPLKIEEAIKLATQIADGLQAAHEKGITHRDIKSANIMITEKNQVKIMDFGLAKLARGGTMLTKEGMTLGTAAYMSPEQARGEVVDHRTDIWSLGVVLYEMISGRLPFRGEYEQAMMYSILNEDPQPLTALRTGLPMELERIANKTLAKKAEERYQHMDEMLVDLRALEKAIESGMTKERQTKAVLPKRKQVYLYGGVASLLILLIGAGFYLWQSREHKAMPNSIAVLPLENLSGDPEQEYFTDGMTEALITNLAKISALRVISRTTVMRYKARNKPLPEIAQELKADVVVEGSVLRSGDRVRITAQLLDAATDRHLWAENYERDLRDILALQSEVAQAIAKEIQIKLTAQDQTRLASVRPINPRAYEAYLKGRYYAAKITKEDLNKGFEHFSQALAIEPSYAMAYDGLAYYHIVAVEWLSSPSEAMPKAREAAKKALEIDEKLAEAHTSLGTVHFWYDWDWVAAEREYKRAMELNPNYAVAHQFYGFYLVAMGRFEQAITELKLAQELEPLSSEISTFLGVSLYFARRYDQAIEIFHKILDLDPNYWFAHLSLGWVYEQTGEIQGSVGALQKAWELEGSILHILAALGRAYAVSGKRDEAKRVLAELQEKSRQSYVPLYSIAIIYAGLGENDKAFEWLEKAYEDRSMFLTWLKVDPQLNSLRADPRFAALLRKVGLEK